MRPHTRALALALAAPLAAAAWQRSFTIREIGFFDLEGPDFELVVHPEWQGSMDGLEELLARSNVRARLAGEGDESHGAPYMLHGAGLPPLSLEEPASAIRSRFRERLLKTTLATYAQLILVHDDFGEKGGPLGEAVQGAMNRLEAMGLLPDPPGARVYSAVVAPRTRDSERVLLWALGLHDLAPDEPAVAVLYGRGKLAGTPPRGAAVTADNLFDQLALLSRSCEIESERDWLGQPRIPLDWPDTVREQASQQLGFDPESAQALGEVRGALTGGERGERVEEAATPAGRGGSTDPVDPDAPPEPAGTPGTAGATTFLLILVAVLLLVLTGGVVLRRRGAGSDAGGSGYALLLASLAAIALLVLGLRRLDDGARSSGTGAIVVACAAGSKSPVAAAARRFEQECGVAVRLQYGGSGTLLSQLRARPEGADLFLAADSSYVERARELGLVREVLTVARQRPVILVQAGNPLGIGRLEDLLAREIRFALANPDVASIGRVTRRIARDAGLWEELEARCKVFKPTVSDLANDVAIGAVDAAVVWDATAAQYGELAAVATPRLAAAVQTVQVGVVAQNGSSAGALRFARFLTAPERGGAEFSAAGFEAVPGDRWAARPALLLHAGSMLEPAIDATVHAFARREGVTVDTVFAGCDDLMGEIRAGASPDALFCCDSVIMSLMGERFQAPVAVSENRLVLVVAKGNPRSVRGLGDLAREGLRVGLAHPGRSALGRRTEQLLQEAGVRDALVASGDGTRAAPRGSVLLATLRAGELDAVVCHESDAASAADRLEVIPLAGEAAVVHQSYAVASASDHPALASRLLDALTTAESRARFEALGFRWLLGDGAGTGE